MKSKCIQCGRGILPQARFCVSCGSRLTIPFSSRASECLAIFRKTDILTIYGVFVAFLGGAIGIAATLYFAQSYHFGAILATLFVNSLFGIISFAISMIGIIARAFKKQEA